MCSPPVIIIITRSPFYIELGGIFARPPASELLSRKLDVRRGATDVRKAAEDQLGVGAHRREAERATQYRQQ